MLTLTLRLESAKSAKSAKSPTDASSSRDAPHPLQWLFLNARPLSHLQSHPFSVVPLPAAEGCGGHRCALCIAVVEGGWTDALRVRLTDATLARDTILRTSGWHDGGHFLHTLTLFDDAHLSCFEVRTHVQVRPSRRYRGSIAHAALPFRRWERRSAVCSSRLRTRTSVCGREQYSLDGERRAHYYETRTELTRSMYAITTFGIGL